MWEKDRRLCIAMATDLIFRAERRMGQIALASENEMAELLRDDKAIVERALFLAEMSDDEFESYIKGDNS